MTERGAILAEVSDYYSNRLAEFGDTAKGVDWRDEASQELRFVQLLKLTEGLHTGFSIADLGCGYGGLLDFLDVRETEFNYIGYDISAAMIDAATSRHAAHPHARFVHAHEPDTVVDFVVASGIFNVRLETSDEAWETQVKETLDAMNRSARIGFAFNCLTTYADADMMRDYLYYADPGKTFDWCKRNYSRNIALLHDYTLYEFTILVRKAA